MRKPKPFYPPIGLLFVLFLAAGCNGSSELPNDMKEELDTNRKIWFQGSNEIECDIDKVKNTLKDLGSHYEGIIRLMPGMKGVELVEQGPDFVTIKTDEGLMKRTNIQIKEIGMSVYVELDEDYDAGKATSTNTHITDRFKATENGVEHYMILSDVKASGFLGFFYRTFGSSSTGNAFLDAYKTYLEE